MATTIKNHSFKVTSVETRREANMYSVKVVGKDTSVLAKGVVLYGPYGRTMTIRRVTSRIPDSNNTEAILSVDANNAPLVNNHFKTVRPNGFVPAASAGKVDVVKATKKAVSDQPTLPSDAMFEVLACVPGGSGLYTLALEGQHVSGLKKNTRLFQGEFGLIITSISTKKVAGAANAVQVKASTRRAPEQGSFLYASQDKAMLTEAPVAEVPQDKASAVQEPISVQLDKNGKPKSATRLEIESILARINKINRVLFEVGVRSVLKAEEQMAFSKPEDFSMEGNVAPTTRMEDGEVASNLVAPMTFNHRMQATLPFMDPDSTRATEWTWLIRNEVQMSTESILCKYTSNSNATFDATCDLLIELFPVGYYKSPYTFRVFIQDPTFPKVPLAVITVGRDGDRPVIVATGDPVFVRLLEKLMAETFFEPTSVRLKKLIEITSNGPAVEEVSLIEGQVDMPTNEFYPFIKETDGSSFDLKEFVDGFMASKASLVVLTGLPGTGKTTLARGIAMVMKPKAMVEASNSITHDQPGFMSFLSSNSRDSLIFIDDADMLVKSREKHGNKQMSGLLGLADGIDSTGAKIIICTNLASLRDVDSALLRSGRMYRKIQFPKLTAEQAHAARASIGLPKIQFSEEHEKNGLVLASALNYEHELATGEHTDVERNGIGFNRTGN